MNPQDAGKVLFVISGYWPTPGLTEEEVIAFTTELMGPAQMTYIEWSK